MGHCCSAAAAAFCGDNDGPTPSWWPVARRRCCCSISVSSSSVDGAGLEPKGILRWPSHLRSGRAPSQRWWQEAVAPLLLLTLAALSEANGCPSLPCRWTQRVWCCPAPMTRSSAASGCILALFIDSDGPFKLDQILFPTLSLCVYIT